MTAGCFMSWAYVHRSYLTEDSQLKLQSPSETQPFAARKIVHETTTSLDWRQLFSDATTLLIIIVSLASFVTWVNIRIQRMQR